MKRGTSFILTSLIAMTVAINAQAQDAATSAEKKAPLKTILPGSYGNIELRHGVARRMEGGNVTNDIPKLDIRPTLGSTFFDGGFDTSFTWIFRKAADTTAVKKLLLYNISKWTVFQGKYGDIGPYAVTYQDSGLSFSESYVGFDANLKRDFEANAGTFIINGYLEPLAAIRSGKNAQDNKVGVRNDTGYDDFALDSTGSTKIEQRDPTLWNYTGVAARFKPSLLPEFYIGLGIDLAQKWDPKYAATEVEGDTRVAQDGYAATAITSNVFKLGYKISDRVAVAGTLRQNIGGYYQQGVGETRPDPTGYWGATRWDSRLSLVATLY